MKKISNGVCAPKGFKAGAAAAGIKKPGTARLDCALIVSDFPATVAGVFTTNVVHAAPVRYCREICASGRGRAIFANSGNANAATGEQGYADTVASAEQVGKRLGIPSEEVLICSTGVIGLPLPMDRLFSGIEKCASSLSSEGGADAARAIMTTDTVPKEMAFEIALSRGGARIGAIAKGSGMIAPNLATMLGFITTDVAMDASLLQSLLEAAAGKSFNCICIDNDMSTNDTVLCLANGASGIVIEANTPDYFLFERALTQICIELAQALVRDGEGATKFIEIEVNGASSDHEARMIASSIAKSQLCKTAFYGQDANWGRIACAAGYSGAAFDPDALDLYIQEVQVLAGGRPTRYSEDEVQRLMKSPEIRIQVGLHEGSGSAVFWTSDLSLEYVKINADYRT